MKPYPDVPDGLMVTRDESVLRIRLDRPERRNSLTDPIVYALTDLIEAAASDEDVRVIHLTGSGDHFCSGFDLGERTAGPDKPRVTSIHRRMSGRCEPAHTGDAQRPDPDRLHGTRVGHRPRPRPVPGLGLRRGRRRRPPVGAVHDVRLHARQRQPWLLPRLAGVARARDMLMLGTKVAGNEAAAWAWCTSRCPSPSSTLPGRRSSLVVAAAPTVALGLTKVLIQRGLSADLDRHLAEEAWAMELSSRSEDFKEYGRAGDSERDPHYRGR